MTMHFFDFGEQSINKKRIEVYFRQLKVLHKNQRKLSLRENNGKCVTQKEKNSRPSEGMLCLSVHSFGNLPLSSLFP